MGCNCGGQAPKSNESYVVTTANGQVKEFTEEPEARIFATMNNGRVTVKRK